MLLKRFFCLGLILSGFIYPVLLTGQEQNIKKSLNADAGAELRVFAGDEVILDGSASRGKELKAFWDFDDRDGVESESTGLIVKHIYKRPGAYVTTITISDKTGKVSWDKKLVEVLTPPSEGLNITDNFEGGYIGQTYKQGNTYRCHLMESINWSVRIDNCEGKPVTLKVYDFGKNIPVPLAITHYRDEAFSKEFKALYTYDFGTKNWDVLSDAEYKYSPETESMEITAIFQRSPVYVGWSFFYTPYLLHNYLSNLPDKKFVNIAYIGKSVQGREIPMVTIGDPEIRKDKTVWVLGGQHGYEVGGISSSEGIIDFLISDDPLAREAREKIEFKIIPLVNPDSHANKWYRFNAHGIDLNRNWDQIDNGNGHDTQFTEPEVAVVKKAINSWIAEGKKRSVFIDIHDWETVKKGFEISPNGNVNIESPENKLFYQEIMKKYLPYAIFYYVKPEQGSFDATGANAPSYFYLNAPGNELSMTIEISLGGWKKDTNSDLTPATPKNIKYIGEQLAKMCLEYFNDSEIIK